MGYKIYKLQNTSCWQDEKPDIVIQCGDPEWEVAYENWLNSKTPTNSKLWNKVFAISCVVSGARGEII